jgi:hypothetical protein
MASSRSSSAFASPKKFDTAKPKSPILVNFMYANRFPLLGDGKSGVKKDHAQNGLEMLFSSSQRLRDVSSPLSPKLRLLFPVFFKP